MKLKTILGSALLCVLASHANQPSFDCAKVKKDSSEGMICASDTLMDLDKELASVYKEALKKASKDNMLKAHQRGWDQSS